MPPFDARREALFDDDEFLALQAFLAANPQAGRVIPGTGGCRKARWGTTGGGKRGGVRVVYLHRPSRAEIVLIVAYGKGERDDVPRPWLRRIRDNYVQGQS